MSKITIINNYKYLPPVLQSGPLGAFGPHAVSIHVSPYIYHIYAIGEEGRSVNGPFLSVALIDVALS
jgi:hypothetical protein